MDAGLAALLGAAVGALGTGGAAAVTGLLGRGQARTQLRAEHVRLLREPRRSAYVAFAQCFQEVHALHSEAAKSAASAVPEAATADPDRDRLLTAADEAYARAGERLHGELRSRQSAVTVEGPPALTAAAFEAEGALLVSRAEVYRWIRALRQGTATPDHERAAEDALLAVHHHLVTFLDAASAALADDGLGP